MFYEVKYRYNSGTYKDSVEIVEASSLENLITKINIKLAKTLSSIKLEIVNIKLLENVSEPIEMLERVENFLRWIQQDVITDNSDGNAINDMIEQIQTTIKFHTK